MKYSLVLLLTAIAVGLYQPVQAQDGSLYFAHDFSERTMSTAEFDDVDTFVASDWVLHDPQFGNRTGIEGFIAWVSWWHSLLPDLRFGTDERLEVDDMIITVWTLTGTHTGDVEGIPASGNTITVRGMLMHHVVDGKLVETWITFDDQLLRLQLGVIDTLGASCERSDGIGCY